MVSDSMGFDATETSFIPLRSCRLAQKPLAIRSSIRAVVVEERVIGFCDSQDSIQPCNFMNNSPQGMNLIPLDSCHRAQKPQCVGFRIHCVPVVDCGSCGTGVRMLRDVRKRVSRRLQTEAKCREPTRHYARLESVMAITRFQTGVSWHFRFFKDKVLKIEL